MPPALVRKLALAIKTPRASLRRYHGLLLSHEIRSDSTYVDKRGGKTGADAFDNVALASHCGFPPAIRHLQTPPWSTVQLRITRAFFWSSSATMAAVDAVSTIGTDPNQDQGRAILNNPRNFWLWAKDGGFDLTHPSTPDSDPSGP